MRLSRRRLLRVASLSAFALSFSALWVLYEHLSEPDDAGWVDASAPPVGTKVPRFALPPLEAGEPEMASDDLLNTAGPVLLNFFASWCAPCLEEMPVLMKLRGQGLAIWGIAYRDRPEATRDFLSRHGNPYRRSARDVAGSMGPVFGLTGIPESVLVGAGGVVRWRRAGGLTQAIADTSLAPLLRAGS
jgi:cytochrome c biogenesis protein CcmG/thiol:disulfide interchange protein DsbE